MARIAAVLTLSMLTCVPMAWAQVADVEVGSNSLSATIELPGGVAVDLSVTFEQVVGLGISAQLVDPTDLGLLSRLPSSVGLPAAFPLLLTIEPPASGPLSFSGLATVEVHTHNLVYTAATPLRLFSGPVGGAFEDITSTCGMGSYRAKGTKPGFSEFLIVTDLRPVDDVIQTKFDRIQQALDDHADDIPEATLAALQDELDDAYWNWSSGGDLLAAIDAVEEFADLVEAAGGSIPNVWRSSRDLTNVSGTLRAGAATLNYSLRYKSSVGQ